MRWGSSVNELLRQGRTEASPEELRGMAEEFEHEARAKAEAWRKK
jgi:hypothetical protein